MNKKKSFLKIDLIIKMNYRKAILTINGKANGMLKMAIEYSKVTEI